jgi:neurofibromin 1
MGFVRYLRQAELGEETLKTRIGLGNLVTSIMSRKRNLTFRHEMHFRNSMVERLMEFVSTNETTSRDALAQAQQADLDIACMKAISACLAGLPLQPLYADEGNPMEAKSKLFLKYCTVRKKSRGKKKQNINGEN